MSCNFVNTKCTYIVGEWVLGRHGVIVVEAANNLIPAFLENELHYSVCIKEVGMAVHNECTILLCRCAACLDLS
jgi:hypothetical protein